MKKLISTFTLIFAFILCSNTNVFAQNKLQLGAGIAYGADIENIGLQVGATYEITENIRGAADFLYYFTDVEGFTAWEFNINGHYMFISEANMNVYGLAGLNYAKSKFDVGPFSGSTSDIGLNIGAGAEFGLGFGSFYGELKYELGGFEQLVIGAGIRFGL